MPTDLVSFKQERKLSQIILDIAINGRGAMGYGTAKRAEEARLSSLCASVPAYLLALETLSGRKNEKFET